MAQTGLQTAAKKPDSDNDSTSWYKSYLLGSLAASQTELSGFRESRNSTYELYREIAKDPTVVLALSIVKDPVIDNSWSFVCTDKTVPSEVLEVTKEVFNPLISKLVDDSLGALEIGFAPFEIVWSDKVFNKVTYLVPLKFKPLSQDRTTVLINKRGQIKGLENIDSTGKKKRLSKYKYWIYTYNPLIDNPYGQSRLENIKDIYEESKQIRERLAQYAKKVSGIIVQLHYPDGTNKNEAGADISNATIARSILNSVSKGNSVAFPNLFAAVDNVEQAAMLAGQSQWKLSILETDKNNQTGGFLEALIYYDRLKFRGLCRPEREGIEGSAGTKSDASIHSDTGRQDSAILSKKLFQEINAGLIDKFISINWGEQYVGKVVIEPAPINRDIVQKWELIKVMLANVLSSTGVLKKVNIDGIFEDIGIPINDDYRGPIDLLEIDSNHIDKRVKNVSDSKRSKNDGGKGSKVNGQGDEGKQSNSEVPVT